MSPIPLPYEIPGEQKSGSLEEAVQGNFDALALNVQNETAALHSPASTAYTNPLIGLNTPRQPNATRATLVMVSFEIDTVTAAGDAYCEAKIAPSNPPLAVQATARQVGLGVARSFTRQTFTLLVPAGWYYSIVSTIAAGTATVFLVQIREATL